MTELCSFAHVELFAKALVLALPILGLAIPVAVTHGETATAATKVFAGLATGVADLNGSIPREKREMWDNQKAQTKASMNVSHDVPPVPSDRSEANLTMMRDTFRLGACIISVRDYNDVCFSVAQRSSFKISDV